MRTGQIDDVDIVADAGAVGRVIVVAKDTQLGADPGGRLSEVRHEVLRRTRGAFADLGRWVRTDGVKVAEQDGAEGCVGVDGVTDDLLVDLLGVAIRRGGGPNGRVLGDGQIGGRGLAVDGAGGGEDDARDAVPRHELEQVEEGDDVVAVIKQRLVDRLANGFAGGKVDDAADGGVLGEDAVHRLAVVAVGLVEGGAPAGDARNAVEDVGRGVRKVVDGDDVVSGLDQLHRGVRSDVACAACHNDCLTHIVWGLVLNTKVERGANGFCIPIPRNPRAPERLSGAKTEADLESRSAFRGKNIC